MLDVARWCLEQVQIINRGWLIDPDSDFWIGNKKAYQLVAIEITQRLGDV